MIHNYEKLNKTVYSFIYPETRETINELWNLKLFKMYEEPWNKKQDLYHKEFFKTWKNWVSKIVKIPIDFNFEYPTAGSSEAIREVINYIAIENPNCKIHIFEGEYEGYEVYAKIARIEIIKHNRDNWKKSMYKLNDYDIFFISQPSSIDGNIWNEFDKFVNFLNNKYPNVRIMLDLCYIGTTVRDDFEINITPNIETIFFSLSKVFGVYYHRIGGMISRKEYKSLYGNIWFKNMFSLKLGTDLMKKYPLSYLPKKYDYVRKELIEGLKISGVHLSDVFLLCTNITEKETEYTRIKIGKLYLNRYCLTQLLDEKIKFVLLL